MMDDMMDQLTSPIERDSDLADRCNYCSKKVGKANLKKCAQCRMVRYCSRVCQKAAWKTHRACCANGAKAHQIMAGDDNIRELNANLNHWLSYWQKTVHTYALIALNLSNSRPDKLATHCFAIEIEYKPHTPRRAQCFQLNWGDVLTRAEIVEHLRQQRCQEEDIQSWLRDQRGDRTVQIAIFLKGGTCRFQWFCILEELWERERRINKEGAQFLAENWVDPLANAFDTGHNALLGPESE